MRFVHLADLHLGKQLNGFSLLEDQRAALERVLRMAGEHEADALVLAGDLYDRTTPSAEATALLDWFLTEAVSAGLKVLAVPGNHDAAERVGYAARLLSEQGVYLPQPFAGALAHVGLADEHGPVNFWLLPFVKPIHVRPYFPDAPIEQDYTAAVRAVIEAAPVNPDERNVLIAHQFVTAAGSETARSDSELTLGGMDNVDAAIFAPFDYVALGHVHRPQRVGRDEVRYAGSLLKYSFSEIPYPKSAVLVDVGQKAERGGECVRFELLPLSPERDLREIRGPLEQLVSAEVVASQNPLDYLHVVLTDETPALDALARLRAVYPHVMAVDYDNARTRGGTSAHAAPAHAEELEPDELFAQFFLEQNGAELTPAQRAIANAALERALGKAGGAR